MSNSFEAQFNRIIKEVNDQISDALNSNNLQNSLVQIGKNHVQEDVYDTYTPKVSKRTGKLLTSWDIKVKDTQLTLHNTREHDGKYIPSIIETGQGYDYEPSEERWNISPVPENNERPFIENTRTEIKESKVVQKELIKHLSKKNYTVSMTEE